MAKFMQDGASSHRSKTTKKYLLKKNIPLFDHPPNSPDLNPIEKVWGEMKRRMREKNLIFRGFQDLVDQIQIEWDNIEEEFINS